MSNKFLNPSGETDLSDVIARVNSNTEAIQEHVADLANPHVTSTSNLDPQPFNSDEVPEGTTNKYLVQPFVGNFDMGGGQIVNVSGVGNPVGQIALGGPASVIALDLSAVPSVGILAQSGVGKNIEAKADGSFVVEATNGEVKLEATNGNVSISSGGAFPNGGVVISNTDATAGVVLLDSTTGNVANISGGGIALQSNAGVLSLQQNDALNNIELKTATLNLNLNEATTKVNILGGDLDMNNNNIDNCPQISNSAGNLVVSAGGGAGVSGASVGIGETTTNMSMAFLSNTIDINQIGTNIASFTPTLNTSFQDLSMDGKNITNVNELTGNKVNTDTLDSQIGGSITVNTTVDMNTNVITNCNRITCSNYETTSGFITFFGVGSLVPSFTPSGLDLNSGDINNATNLYVVGNNNITLPVVIGTPSGALQVQNGGAYIKQDLQVDGTIYCDNINGIRPSGGLYSESSGFSIPSTNLTETNLLGQGGSAGTLAVPAGGFSQYDSYSFKASGVLTGGTNDLFTLRLKSLVGGTTPVELGSIAVTLTDNGLVDIAWKVEADFNVRTLGGAGVGVIVLSGNFTYTNNNDVIKTYLRTIVNGTVFDTTQSNELQFTFQNDATNPLTNIRIDQASFTKWY